MVMFIFNFPGGLMMLFGLLFSVFWLYALVDVVKSDFKDPNMKLVWIIILIFANPIGPFIYFGLVKNQKGARRRSNYFNR
jgi:hypothetical protein